MNAAGEEVTDRRRALLVLAWFIAACSWGASFLFIEIGLRGLAPGQVALARLLFGTLFLGAWLLLTRTALPRRLGIWAHLGVLGLLFCFLPFTLFAWAETHISSGLAAILNATTPLWTLVLVLAFVPTEHVSARKIAGVAVGFVGVVIVALPSVAGLGGEPVTGQLACLAATACYGAGFVWLRRYVLPRGTRPLVIAFGQVSTGLLWSVLAAPALSWEPVSLSVPVVAAMLALGVLGTGLAFVLNTAVTAGLGATFASTVTYLSPVIGVLLGVLVLAEQVTAYEAAGGAVVVLGVAVGQGLLRLPRRAPVPPPHTPPAATPSTTPPNLRPAPRVSTEVPEPTA